MSSGSSTTISASPAFADSDLSAQASDDWITNGGSVSNDRYSTLTDINDSNVQNLKGVWRTHLDPTVLAAKYSGEGQPLEYKGVIYMGMGDDNAYAVSVKTGKVIWTYKANLDQSISTVCCGWDNRGLALGDGKVYVGQLDGNVVALDQMTGKVVWKNDVADWKKNGSGITSAPLYYNGLVYTGMTGGEFGVRAHLTALDAKTGATKWLFYTTPSSPTSDPVASPTWPSNGSSLHGGAPIWQTPSVDPATNSLIFTTGNAAPDINGSQRKGDDLYSASFVSLDATTGTYKWHYQMVHHDIWDFDAPSPTLQFDVVKDGQTIPAIGEAEKTGWFYILNRNTGVPIFPTKETPVQQDAYNQTSATQPFPSYPPFASQTVTPAQVASIKAQLKSTAPGQKVTGGPMYAAIHKGAVTVTANGASGGTNWQPSSYNPNTHLAYVCGMDGAIGESSSDLGKFVEDSTYIGSVIGLAGGFGMTTGVFAAIDVNTGLVKWSKQFPNQSCYSGSTTTAGNLVFNGENTGVLDAYNATTGDKLWSFQTGAGANSSPTEFRYDGQEYLAFLSGGNALAATQHGDSLWLFGLNGTMGPATAGDGAQGITHSGEADAGASTTATDTTSATTANQPGNDTVAGSTSSTMTSTTN